ncbi:bifunctional alpha/beta hydrolase/OsmC family protein [Fulvivirga lutea]|uniref:OsmC family protein n=1 Tax=Fulvivirga lutea TaxID=2810512 RepID=A0A974WMU7_9BACT|nr:bifunctional alpha/beta hydrolase/OsmC family protein [Fulvivirga lutea]QSE98358.1 OsmC family protein [Fulvivirga lutea]
MKLEPVKFQNTESQTIHAILELPVDGNPLAYAIFAHCFTCSKDLKAVVNISRAMTQKGIAVLRFDFTGLGSSEGDFSNTNFNSNISDLVSAYDFMKEQYKAPAIIIGHSLGGAAVLAAAHQMPEAKAVVTIGSPFDPGHVTHMFDKDLETIKKEGEATVKIGGRPFKIRQQFIEDIEQANNDQKISKLKKSLLVMHSPQDEIVGVENARKIYEAAHHPKSFISLDGANHLLTKNTDSSYVGNIIAAWAERYVEYKKENELTSEKQVTVRTGMDKYLTEIKTENHYLLADEPKSLGGGDFGPSPYDLLVAALGACTGMTLRMYADRKEIDLKEVKVHLQHSKEHTKDSENPESKSSVLDQIEREIELTGNLTAEQRDRLLEIADKCPVHRTLHNEIVVKTKLI